MRPGRADRLVGILDVIFLLRVAKGANVIRSPRFEDEGFRVAGIEFGADSRGVGTHVRDQTDVFPGDVHAFVQTLGDRLSPRVREMVFRVGFLLHRGSRKGEFRVNGFRSFDNRRNRQFIRDSRDNRIGLFFRFAREGLAIDFDEAGFVFLSGDEDFNLNRPIFFRYESVYFFLSFDDHAEGRALHATGALDADIALKQGGHLKADDAIFHSPSFLGLDEIFVNGRRALKSFENRGLRDFVEAEALRGTDATPGPNAKRWLLPRGQGRSRDKLLRLYGRHRKGAKRFPPSAEKEHSPA